MGYKVHELQCGSFCPHLAGKLFPTDHFSCRCLLIETGSSLVLCDTGLPQESWLEKNDRTKTIMTQPRSMLSDSAFAQIEALGFKASDVQDIILTHVDLDHAGGLADFPWARIHLHFEEYQLTSHIPKSQQNRYLPALWEHKPKFEFYKNFGDDWMGLKGVKQLKSLSPEILLIPLVGHSPGHCGIAIQSDQGWILHAGDSFYFWEDLNYNLRKRNAASEALQALLATSNLNRHANMINLIRLHKGHPDLRLINSHDPRLGLKSAYPN